MSLVQKLKSGALDIVGDIHGEIDALHSLLSHLGYDKDGYHPQGRKLVFVGDLCDRGPDSPAVINLVKHLIEKGNAQAILGNHELNLLQKKAKDGAGWFFEERVLKDKNYVPFKIVTKEEQTMIYDFLSSLPLALENEELRVVHAAWSNECIEEMKALPEGHIAHLYKIVEDKIEREINESGLLERYNAERSLWDEEDPDAVLPFLEATSEYNLIHQMGNPFRVLTSGVEQRAVEPFYTSGKWRFVQRNTWWNDYSDDKPVVVGHFWRKMVSENNEHGENVFANVEPTSWHGLKHNVFCVDYSVGARFKERNAKVTVGENTMLAALSWPEKTLTLENGQVLETDNFKKRTKMTP